MNQHQSHSHHNHHRMMMEDFKKRFVFSLALTIPVLFLSSIVQDFLGFKISFTGDKYLVFVLSAIIFFYGGKPFLRGALEELKKKQPGMMTLIGLAVGVAFFYSSAVVFGLKGKFFFWELVTLIDIMLLGHWIEMKSILGASKALETMAKLLPSSAHLIKEDGEIRDVPLSELAVGDVVLVKPGEKIPADGTVIKGETSVNESMITGESKPVEKTKDSGVIGGSVNGQGSVEVKIKNTGKDSYISQVVEFVKKAQESKSKTQNLADKAAMWLTIISISVGFITLFSWMYFEKDFVFSLERMVTVMVITCPHALGLAVPLVAAVSTSLAAGSGFLIRNRSAFENARRVNAVVFDKTGTLTKGEFGVTEIINFSDAMDKDEILALAASVDSRSSHPVAQGIVKSSKNIYKISDFVSIPGKGASAKVNDNVITVASKGYLKEKRIKAENNELEEVKKQGKTIVYVLKNNKPIGAIALADMVRPESKEAIAQLKHMDIKTIMLTGDTRQVAEQVAKQIGIDEFMAEVLPEEKSSKIKQIQSRNLIVAMTGDGVNDAPALAQADVGIAVGAGTDVAIETADIILVRNNPLDIVGVIGLARATYGKMVQNLIWATGYNVFAIPLAAGVLYNFGILLSPAIGAILMSLSTFIVAINAKFLSVNKT